MEKSLQNVVDNAVIGENFQQHPRQDRPGKEIGDKDDGLYRTLEPALHHLIEHQGQYHRNHHIQENKYDIIKNRISRNNECIRCGKEELEIVEPHPFAGEEALQESSVDLEFLECNHDTEHG